MPKLHTYDVSAKIVVLAESAKEAEERVNFWGEALVMESFRVASVEVQDVITVEE